MLYIAIAKAGEAASDDGAYFFGFMGIASALVFASNISPSPVIYVEKIWDLPMEQQKVESESVHSRQPRKVVTKVFLRFAYQLLWPVSWVCMGWLWALSFNKRVIHEDFYINIA